MAISNGIKGMISGSAGDLTYSVKGGELVISARVSKMTNPRTPTQMIQRIKFPNIVALYRSFRGLLDECFEQRRRKDRKSLVPIYNRFIGANLFSLPVYLTRTESATGYCIAAPSFGFSSAPRLPLPTERTSAPAPSPGCTPDTLPKACKPARNASSCTPPLFSLCNSDTALQRALRSYGARPVPIAPDASSPVRLP